MAIKAKQIIDTAVDVGKTAVEAAERRIRGRKSDSTPSGAPSTVGAAKPGKAGSPKSATASTRATKPRKAKPKAKAKAKPAAKKKAKATPTQRSTARRAAASSGKEVSDAAKST